MSGEHIAQSLAEALPHVMKKVRDEMSDRVPKYLQGRNPKTLLEVFSYDWEDKTPDIHGPVHAEPDHRLCHIRRHGRDCDRHGWGTGRIRDEGTRE